MKGRLCTQYPKLRTRILRHEDLVLRPKAVLEGLAALGLPRKKDPSGEPIPFEEITVIRGGHRTNKSREVADLRRQVLQAGVWAEYCLDKLANRLELIAPLLDAFGYPRKAGQGVDTINTFGDDVEFDLGALADAALDPMTAEEQAALPLTDPRHPSWGDPVARARAAEEARSKSGPPEPAPLLT